MWRKRSKTERTSKFDINFSSNLKKKFRKFWIIHEDNFIIKKIHFYNTVQYSTVQYSTYCTLPGTVALLWREHEHYESVQRTVSLNQYVPLKIHQLHNNIFIEFKKSDNERQKINKKDYKIKSKKSIKIMRIWISKERTCTSVHTRNMIRLHYWHISCRWP